MSTAACELDQARMLCAELTRQTPPLAPPPSPPIPPLPFVTVAVHLEVIGIRQDCLLQRYKVLCHGGTEQQGLPLGR